MNDEFSKLQDDRTREDLRRYFPTPQAADYLGLKAPTLEKWRSEGGGPPFVKLGRAVRYRVADLDQFAAERVRAHTAQRKVTV